MTTTTLATHLLAADLLRADDPVTVHVALGIPGDGTETWHASDRCPAAAADGTRPRAGLTAATLAAALATPEVYRCGCLNDPDLWDASRDLPEPDRQMLRWLDRNRSDHPFPLHRHGHLAGEVDRHPGPALTASVATAAAADLEQMQRTLHALRRSPEYRTAVAVQMADLCVRAHEEALEFGRERALGMSVNAPVAALLYDAADDLDLGNSCQELTNRTDDDPSFADLAAHVYGLVIRHQVWVALPDAPAAATILRYVTDVAPRGRRTIVRVPVLALWSQFSRVRLLTAVGTVDRVLLEDAAELTPDSLGPVDDLLAALVATTR